LPATGSLRARAGLRDLLVSGVDSRNPRRRQRDAFGRQTLRNHQIGMTLAHQTMIGLTHCAHGSARQYAENSVRIFENVARRAGIERPNAGIIGRIEPEMPGDFAQIIVFCGADAAIGEGNMEKTAKKILEDTPVGSEQPADLSGIALEPRCALARKVEYEPDMLFFTRRDLKDLAECGDLVPGDGAVSLRHFGAERDYGDRECDAATRIALHALALAVWQPVWNMAGGASEQHAERAAERQVAGTGDDTADKAHLVRSSVTVWVGHYRDAALDNLSRNANL